MAAGRKAPPLTDPGEIELWNAIVQRQGEVFHTSGRGTRLGVAFTYKIRGAEIFVSTKAKSISRSPVIAAYRKTQELEGVVGGPKELGVFGASYIFPIFLSIGIIQSKGQNKYSEKSNLIFDSKNDSVYNCHSEPQNISSKELTSMPRPKGSKNKSTLEIIENAEEKIAQLEAEIEKLTSDLKAKKDELKAIVKAKAEADKAAAAKKAEEDKQKLLAAFAKSGKSIEEILEMLK